MIDAYKKMWTNYANFNGCTSRKDFWLAIVCNFLVAFVIGFVLGFISGLTGIKELSYLSYIYSIAILIPSLAIEVRRLHDINKSGWFILICLVPLVGSIILLVFLCMARVEPNSYGEQV